MPPLTPTPEPRDRLVQPGQIEKVPILTMDPAIIVPDEAGPGDNDDPPEMLEQLKDFVDETHLRYDDLDNDLQLALEKQEKMFHEQQAIAERIELMRRQAWASRLVFAQNISTARELMAAGMDKASTKGEGEVFTPPEAPSDVKLMALSQDDVVSYADPTPAAPLTDDEAKHRLFRPRDANESLTQYQARVNKQKYVLAREHYEQGVRQRNAHAEKVWTKLENKDGMDGRPATGESPQNDRTATGPGLAPPPRAALPEGNPDRQARGGPPDGGPPSSDSDGSSPSSDDEARPPRGTTTPHRRSPSYLKDSATQTYLLHPDANMPNSDFMRKQLDIIRAAIRDRVGRDLPNLAPMKNLKNIPPPEKYGGEDDSDAFMGWLKSFLRWLALGRIIGPELDADRVQLLGQHLIKEARLWYDDTIDTFDGVGRDWSFEQSLCAMYKRFIHRSTARAAADKFQRVRYKRETGVSGLWDSLVALTRKMPEVPDEYSFKVRFVDALPEDICAPMLRHQGVSIDRSTPGAIRNTAMIQEENNRVLDDWRVSHRSSTARDTDRVSRSSDRNDRGTPSLGGLRPPTSQRTQFVRNPPMGTPRGPFPPRSPGPARPHTPPTGSPAALTGSRGAPTPAARASAATTTSGTQCYNCRVYGHISANCPKAQAPRLRAVRVLEEPSYLGNGEDGNVFPPEPPTFVGDEHAEVEPPIAEPLPEHIDDPDALYESDEVFYDMEGSQYDPDMGDECAEAYSDHGDNDVWFGAMRIVYDDLLRGDDARPIEREVPDIARITISDPPSTMEDGPRSSAPVVESRVVFRDPVVIPYTDDFVLRQGEPRPIAEIEAMVVAQLRRMYADGFIHQIPYEQMVASSTHADDETYDDMPALEFLDDVEASNLPAPPPVPNERRAWAHMSAPEGYTGPIVELPLDADLDDVWARFVDSDRTDDDVTQILMVLYRMVHQNNHSLRELYDSRNRIDALSDSLSWTRRELAAALFRESEGLNTLVFSRASAAEQQRRRVRVRVRTETNPLTLDDDESDEPDDSAPTLSLADANDLLMRVTTGMPVPTGTGLDPPGYERICRANPRFAAMTVAPGSEPLVTRARAGRRPLLSEGEQECIVLLLTVNGLGALTLCDAGSTTEMLSNDFARVAGCDIIKLENPATLQLGCAGSRSRINFGTRSPVTLGVFGAEVYFDIANLDRYDAVLGTPFLRRFGVMLDFKNNCVHLDGQIAATDADAGSTAVEPPTTARSTTPPPVELPNPPPATSPEARRLCDALLLEFSDLFQPVPPGLPPLRAVNHTIPLVDPKKRYHYHLPRCPEVLRPQVNDKIQHYTRAGWWEPHPADQAAPLLCVYKKDGRLRTVVDLRQHNENTVRDVTPFPDQDQIRNDVAHAPFRSKLDMSDAYEQIRIVADDVGKTAFATIFGTLLSHVMQQGDCNAPSTFQRLMTHVFRERLGKTIHVYLDDIFIFTRTLADHLENVRWVFSRLREQRMFLSAKKVDVLSSSMDCLGHVIDDRGLHADSDKMIRIRDWPIPRNWHDVQRFLGLVQYLSHFMPDASAYTGPLSSMMRNGQFFYWRPLHQKCFDQIKTLTCKSPILRPIDAAHPDPIWVVTDASYSGVGAMYGQGPTWETCRPAGFMSKKFTSAQFSYFTFEQEALAVVEALLKWEDKLLGRRFMIVTDHKSLRFLKEKQKLIPRLQRWMEYIGRFDYDVLWVEGVSNRVADALSRYYTHEEATAAHAPYDLVSADARLDPDGDTLDNDHIVELRASRVEDRREDRELAAAELAAHAHQVASPGPQDDDPVAFLSTGRGQPLDELLQGTIDIRARAREGYAGDAFFSKIIAAPDQHARFRMEDGLIWHLSRNAQWVLCLPKVYHGQRVLTEIVISHAHDALGHLGYRRTSDYVRRWFWWPSIGVAIEKYCRSCGICQTTKASTQLPAGLLHSLPLPEQPWESIAMDFVGPFPECDGCDYLWVVVDCMSSTVHLIPTTTTVRASELAWIFVREIVRLHGLPSSIVSDRDSKFISKFWREVHRLLGTKLLMSTAYHPQTDRTSERAVRTVSQILRAMVDPNQRDWARKVPLVEFAMNSSRSVSTGFAPFELTGGFMPRMIRALAPEPALPGVTEFAQRALDYLSEAHDHLIASRVEQTHYSNRRRRPEDPLPAKQFEVGQLAYLSTEKLNLPKGRAHKLLPKFVGPYPIARAHPASSNYTLELPASLLGRGINPTFHVSRLRPHEPNDDTMFPHRDVQVFYDFGDDPEREFLVDNIVAHELRRNAVVFLVQWADGDTTWEPWTNVQDLAATDRYLETLGVADWQLLPRPLDRSRRPSPAPPGMGDRPVPSSSERAASPLPIPSDPLPTGPVVPLGPAPAAPHIRRTNRVHKPRVRTS
ncbi:hypothetical protein VTO73DRAFT_14349 [Trametes versicolor]